MGRGLRVEAGSREEEEEMGKQAGDPGAGGKGAAMGLGEVGRFEVGREEGVGQRKGHKDEVLVLVCWGWGTRLMSKETRASPYVREGAVTADSLRARLLCAILTNARERKPSLPPHWPHILVLLAPLGVWHHHGKV